MEKPSNEAWKRIITVIEVSGAPNINAFSKQIGLSRSEVLYRVQRGENGISRFLAQKIREQFPCFSLSWLMFGGDHSPEYLRFRASNRLVMIPFYEDINIFNTENYFYLPDALTKGAEIAVLVKNDVFCKFPHSGSIVLLKRADNFIDYGKVYLVRADGINALCAIQPVKTHGKITLKPIETEKFGEIVIDTDSVSEIYEICGIFIV